MSLDAKVEEADRTGLGFGAIDKWWVARHPFSLLGDAMFGKDFVLKGGRKRGRLEACEGHDSGRGRNNGGCRQFVLGALLFVWR